MTDLWLTVAGVVALLLVTGVILWVTRGDDETPP